MWSVVVLARAYESEPARQQRLGKNCFHRVSLSTAMRFIL
jgi:hypothetical protein